MTGDAPTTYRGHLRADWERFVHASHRYFVPASAAVCVGVAGAIAVGRYAALAPFVPALLGATGAGLAATAVAYRLGRAASSDGGAAASAAPVVPTRSAVGVALPPLVFPSVRVARPEPVRPSPRAPPVAAWSVGDELWSHWVVPNGARLPSELVGPVPETAYAAPRAGGFVAFPGREPEFAVAAGKLVAIPEAEFAPDEEAAAEVPVPVSDAAADDLAELIPMVGLEGSASAVGDLGPSLAPVVLHPVAFGRARVERPKRPAPEPPSLGPPLPRPFARPECASCGETLDEEREGHPCPACDQPVCSRCRRMAVIHYGQTWCAACATENGWSEVAAAT